MAWWQNGTMVALLAIAISSIGLMYLTHTDPKRRRAHRMPTSNRSTIAVVLAMLMVCSPLIWVLAIEHYGALCMWLAGITVIGWLMAWKRPRHANHQTD